MVIIILGSSSDLSYGNEIAVRLSDLGIENRIKVASAHKTPEYLLDFIKKNEKDNQALVYICVAGRSNALGGLVDAQTHYPVINCPPYSEKYAGLDIFSSLRMPSGVAAMTVLEPDQAALAAAKILSLNNSQIRKKVAQYQKKLKEKIIHNGQTAKSKNNK